MRVLITGSAGFVGSHTVEHFLKNTDWDLVGLDSLRHGGLSDRIRHLLPNPRYEVITHDLAAPISSQTLKRIGKIDYILNLASNSHVDHSIQNPIPFIQNNVNVALNVCEALSSLNPKKLIHCSTDEIFGPAMPGQYHAEWEPFFPSNPYSASKVCQEAIFFSFWRTYGSPVIFTRCMNMIGERQGREKYLPLLISRISKGELVHIHGTPDSIGSRMYLHARNLADAWLFLLKNHEPNKFEQSEKERSLPSAFNVIGEEELTNLDLANIVSEFVGKELRYEFLDFHSTRPGHDFRYALSPKEIFALGWKPPVSLRDSLKKTVDWYLRNQEWL